MANSYTNRLKKRLPAVGDSGWDDEWHDNEKIDDVIQGALLTVNRIISGGAVTDGGDLTVDYTDAVIRLAGAQLDIVAGNVALTGAQAGAQLSNWLYINNSGAVTVSLTPPAGNYIPLALINTDSVGIAVDGGGNPLIADLRPMTEAVTLTGNQTIIDVKTFTSSPVVPTPAAGDFSTKAANAEFVQRERRGINSIIDGNFDVWLEATSQTTTGYGSDTMWFNGSVGSTKVHTRQSFALGQTLVPGNPRYLSSTAVTSVAGASNHVRKEQRIESVLSLAGQTATLSFFADVNAAKNIAIEFTQNFGTGGSPSTLVTGIGSQLVALTPGFKKYTITVSIPSVTGKTLGTDNNDYLSLVFWFDAGSTYATRTANLGQQSGTYSIAQVQLEKGSVATEFERLALGETMHLVEKYANTSYEFGRFPGSPTTGGLQFSWGSSAASTIGGGAVSFPKMRAVPATTLYDSAGNPGKISGLSTGAAMTNNLAFNAATVTDSTLLVRIYNQAYVGLHFNYFNDARL